MKTATRDNALLALLPARDRRNLIGECKVVELRAATVLARQHQPIREVYFPIGGVISLLTQLDRRPAIEVGLIGGEGAVGAVIALGAGVTPVAAVVQVAGPALIIGSRSFTSVLDRSAALRAVMARYLYCFVAQLASSVSCVRFHLVEARLARWLLMTRDRVGTNEFHLTHEFIACMLGVRRVGVTHAAQVLRTQKLVGYSRGHVWILDAKGLKLAACSCYETSRHIYTQVMSGR